MNSRSKTPHSVSDTSWFRAWPGYAVLALLGFFLVVMLIAFELDGEKGQKSGSLFGYPYGQNETNTVLGWLSVIIGLGLVLCGVTTLRRGPPGPFLTRALKTALIVLVLVSGVVWSYCARGVGQTHYVKMWDSFHYHLGPKYFDELGYFGFYDCVAQADLETVKILTKVRVRDLRDYGKFPRSKVAAKRGKCHEKFSSERWEEFKSDYRFYAKASPGNIRGAVRDHGYNGTPAHVFVAKHLSNSFQTTYENLVFATLLDTLPLFLMFAVLCWAVGWPLALLSAALFFTSFSDRAFFIAGSFFRYHWMILSGLGLAALAKRRNTLAGAFFASAAMLNVFPIFFLAAMGFRIVLALDEKKTLSRDQWRFLLGVAGASIFWGLLSVSYRHGIGNYFEFFDKMDEHSELVTRSRIGLRYVLAYRGEHSASMYDSDATERIIKSSKTVYYLVTGGLLGLLAFATRRLGDVQATALVAVAMFFYLFGTVEYYYGIFAFIVVFLHGAPLRGVTFFLLAIPFLLNAVVYWIYKQTESLGIANNSGMSFAVLLTLLAYQAAALLPLRRPLTNLSVLFRPWIGHAPSD